MTDLLARTAKALQRTIRLAIGRAVLAAVNDTGGRQLIQIQALKGEVKDDIQRVQNYGFTSVPLGGAEVVIVCVGANRDHAIAINVDDPRYRKADMQNGEVAIYTDEGDEIYLRRGRQIEITTTKLLVKATEEVRLETPLLAVTGEITDRCDEDGRSMRNMREVYNTHTHNETDSVTHVPNQQMGDGA